MEMRKRACSSGKKRKQEKRKNAPERRTAARRRKRRSKKAGKRAVTAQPGGDHAPEARAGTRAGTRAATRAATTRRTGGAATGTKARASATDQRPAARREPAAPPGWHDRQPTHASAAGTGARTRAWSGARCRSDRGQKTEGKRPFALCHARHTMANARAY